MLIEVTFFLFYLINVVEVDLKRGREYCLTNPLRHLQVLDCTVVQIPFEDQAPILVGIQKPADEQITINSRLLRTGRGNLKVGLRFLGSSLRVGTLTINKLGTLSFELPGHHTSECIFPIGFRSTRIFWSMTQPLQRTMYTFEVCLFLVSVSCI